MSLALHAKAASRRLTAPAASLISAAIPHTRRAPQPFLGRACNFCRHFSGKAGKIQEDVLYKIPMMDRASSVDELFMRNAYWRQQVVSKDPEFFDRLKSTQRPRYLWIGCSDSRVSAEQLCGMPPGTLFVHRNIANVVNNVDVSCMSVIQYAVTALKVQHIVICGHYNCGGVAAAMENNDHHSPLENWLRNIRDVYRLHRKELDAIEDKVERARRLVEINVVEQAINIFKTRVVQKRRVETYESFDDYGFIQPRIHPVVYDPGTGKLERLDVQMKEKLANLISIYSLYENVDDDEAGERWSGMGPSYLAP